MTTPPATWVCNDAENQTVSSTGGKVNLDKGDQVTCEITNDRDTAELKLVKKVDGGNQVPDDWTLAADAAAPLDDKDFSNLGGQGTFKSRLHRRSEYTLVRVRSWGLLPQRLGLQATSRAHR